MIPFFARQYVSGEELRDALRRVKHLNSLGVSGIIDRLGEGAKTPEEVKQAFSDYVEICKAIRKEKLDACISLKLSSLGLDLSKQACLEALKDLLREADKQKVFVWVDMEDYSYVTETISIFERLVYLHKNVGLCLQADLRRTEKDLKMLQLKKARIRLVKGVYKEQKGVAFQEKDEVEENFVKLMELLFKGRAPFALGTHDLHLVHHAMMMSKKHPNTQFEFQMLMGVRDELKPKMVGDGFKVSEYVPFGKQWLPYYTRRMREKLGV